MNATGAQTPEQKMDAIIAARSDSQLVDMFRVTDDMKRTPDVLLVFNKIFDEMERRGIITYQDDAPGSGFFLYGEAI